MPNASAAFGQLRYCVESVIGTTPASPGINLRQTGVTIKPSLTFKSSNEIASHRMLSSQAKTDLDITGGFNFDLSVKEYDSFFEGLLGSAYSHYGTLGIGTTFTNTTTSSTITASVAPTTTSAFTNLVVGQWFKLVPPVGASQAVKDYFYAKWLKVHASTAPTSTVITLDAATPLAGVGIVSAVAGYAVSTSTSVNSNTLTRGFTIEHAQTDITQFFPFQGCQVNTLDLDFQVGEIVKGSFDFIGRTHSGGVAATTFTGGPTASQTLEAVNAANNVGMLMRNGTNILTAGSFVKSMKLNVTNSLRGQKAVGTFGNGGVGFGELAITGNMSIYLQDSSLYNEYFNATNSSLAFGVQDALGNGYMFEMDKLAFNGGDINQGGINDDVMLDLTFKAFYNSATSRGIRLTRAVSA